MFQYFEAARVGSWLDKTSTQTRRHRAFSEFFFDPIQKHQPNTLRKGIAREISPSERKYARAIWKHLAGSLTVIKTELTKIKR
jgi:hypothetical protein